VAAEVAQKKIANVANKDTSEDKKEADTDLLSWDWARRMMQNRTKTI
jgi:hypothetical protein